MIGVFEIVQLEQFQTFDSRLDALEKWHKSDQPSVMIIGYDLFRLLTADKEDQSTVTKKVGRFPYSHEL